MNKWNKLADRQTVEEVMRNLKRRNITPFFVEDGEDAINKFLEIVPEGLEVLASTSRSVEEIGLLDVIENSGKYKSVRKKYMSYDHDKEADKIRIERSTPELIVASVHAVTKEGEVLIASNTGSQIAAYSGGAGKVVWVVGVQKIVENKEEGLKRIYEYVLPLESERLKKLHGVESGVSKLLIFSKEVFKDRVSIIFVNQALGF
jgi:hypothetical protein